MGTASRIRLGASILASHPVLGTWYLRNRLRVATLPFERARLAGYSRFARGLTFRLTWACNLRCKMCRYAQNGNVCASPSDVLPLDAWTSLVDDVSRFRPYISMTGGEPLMYPHTEALIRHTRERNMRCTLTTNGTLLAKKAPLLMEAPPDMLIVSLDGPRDVHNTVRGQPKTYERAVEGIAAVRELKHRSKQNAPAIVINCAITPHNYEHGAAIVKIARDLQATALNCQYQWSLTPDAVSEHNAAHDGSHSLSCEEAGAADPPHADPVQMVEAVRRIRRAAASLRDPLMVTFHPNLTDSEVHEWYSNPRAWVQRRPAVCAWINTNILPNGDVEPCSGVVCGNITQAAFSQIWNGPPYRAFRRRLAAAGDFPICVRCCVYFRRD
ncbi:MAG: radical SAM protein [Armatimonadota bacterium]|nr:MAG: radical SAM protein [Armatimonadota bacterium]